MNHLRDYVKWQIKCNEKWDTSHSSQVSRFTVESLFPRRRRRRCHRRRWRWKAVSVCSSKTFAGQRIRPSILSWNQSKQLIKLRNVSRLVSACIPSSSIRVLETWIFHAGSVRIITSCTHTQFVDWTIAIWLPFSDSGAFWARFEYYLQLRIAMGQRLGH